MSTTLTEVLSKRPFNKARSAFPVGKTLHIVCTNEKDAQNIVWAQRKLKKLLKNSNLEHVWVYTDDKIAFDFPLGEFSLVQEHSGTPGTHSRSQTDQVCSG